MKKTLTLLFLSLCYFVSQAQITLVSTDMPVVPWTNVMHKDTSTGAVNWGNKGANQVYDFSAFQNNKPDSLFYLAPTSAQTSAIPAAQIAITGDHSTYIFSKNASTLYDYVGGQVVYSGTTILTPFSPIDTGYKFAVTYGHTFHGTYGFTTTQPGSAFGQPAVNQVRITNTTTYTDSIDGWGTVKTPTGTYNCLRQHRVEHSSTLLEYNLCGICPWSNVPTGAGLPNNPIVSTTNVYNYLAKETHGTVISFTYDSAGNPLTASWSTTPPVPIAKFHYVIGASGAVTFTDSSVTAPLTYSWNFGDGTATSSAQSPNHTFTANGTYYVCETVTNASGNSTFCDSVHITNIVVATIPPTAGNDIATVTQPGTVNIPALANDVNHNAGDTLCINSIIGAQAGWAVLSGCSTIVFHPLNANYTGLDTFYYKVCDEHAPTLCDTAMVVVDVLPALIAPTAVNDTASVIQPGSVNISAAANDINHNAGHTMCITSVWGGATGWASVQSCSSISFHALDPYFLGYDTFYYKICDVQLPALCDTGMVIVDVRTNASVPVANFTVANVLCTGRTFTSTSTGADTLTWNFNQIIPSGAFDTAYYNTSTVAIADGAAHYANNNYQVCLTARNIAGIAQKCDTVAFTCLGVEELSASDIQIYPNPASSEIKVDLSKADRSDLTAIELYDMLGNKVRTVAVANITVIGLSGLSNGVYMISATDRSNARKTLGKFEVVR